MGNEQTLNENTGLNQDIGGFVHTDSPHYSLDSQNTVSDIDDDRSSSSEQDDKGKAGADGSSTDDGKATKADAKVDAQSGDDDRFDKHPRFQELIKSKHDLEIQLAEMKGKYEGATAHAKPQDKEKPAELPFKDIGAMTEEQIAEWQTDDPKGFAANLKAQARYEAEQAIRTEFESRTRREQEEGGIKKTYETFEEKNPEFRKMWDSGDIMKFMQSNPGHNPISAYREMTFEKTIKDAVEEAVAKAKKETEEEVTRRFKSKTKASVLTGGPGVHGKTEEDPKLLDTKQHGGKTAVIAERLAAMRRSSGR